MADKLPSETDEAANSAQPQPEPSTVTKPFKKAKYAWQIKGKGRLKNSSQKNNSDEEQGNSKRPRVPPIENVNRISPPETGETQSSIQEIAIQPSSPINSSETFSSLEQMILLKEKEIESDFRNSSETGKKNKNKKNCLEADQKNELSPNSPRSRNGVFFPSEMAAQCVEQFLNTLNQTNYNLRKWQTKQVAKTIIDNAINKVLEDMGFILPADAFDFHLSSSDSDISPQNIENEGVSEAIRQQGLQQRSFGESWMPGESEADVSKKAEQVEEKEKHQSTTCTCWLHWKPERNSERTECLSLMAPSIDQDSVLDAAVSFAISEKGLGVLADQEL